MASAQPDGDARVELWPAKSLLVLAVAIGLLLIGIGAAVLSGLLPAARGAAGERWLGAFVVVFGAGTLAGFAPMLLRPQPIVVADACGLHHLPRFGRGASYAWDQIAAVGAVRLGKHHGLGLWMKDRAAVDAGRPAWRRPLQRLQAAFGGADRKLAVMNGRTAIAAFCSELAARHRVEVR